MRKLIIIGLLILFSSISTLAEKTRYHDIDDTTYRLAVPESYTEDTPIPLMIALHSTSSSPHAMAVMTGFDDYAETIGVIVAYPQADGIIWNEGDPRFGTDRDDVTLINHIVEDIQSQYNINPDQIMLSGFGSAGLMAYRIACESPETFDTIAIVGVMMWGYHADNCPETSAPVNIIIFRGGEDIIYLEDTYDFRGLFDTKGQLIFGIDDTLAHWSTRFNCTASPFSAGHIRINNHCDDDVQVVYFEMVGARQNWLRNRDDWTLNQFGVDVSDIILRFASGDNTWQFDEPMIVDSLARTYSFYVPTTYDETQETPVVIVLHGRFGSGAGTASHIQINPLAEEHGFIGVYPDGLDNKNSGAPRDMGWNYIRDIPYFPETEPQDDVQFIADVIDDISQDLNIDRNRIYVTGLSNGGFMVQRLACEAPELYAGYASVAGAGYGGMNTICDSDTPVNMLIMHGTLDNNIQWNGNVQTFGEGQQFYMTMPIPETLAFWAQKMGCFGDATREDVDIPESDAETGLVILTAGDCQGNAELALYAIINGGHNWPGIDGGIPSQVAGLINVDVDATQIIWDFFASHSVEDFD
jgi:polyhydroxybutyrate depolymerase